MLLELNQNGISHEGKPNHPLIHDHAHRDTLERTLQVLELIQNLDLSKGLDTQAQLGLFWVHQMLTDTIQYVSDSLKEDTQD